MPPGVVGLSIAHMFSHVKLGGWGYCLYLTQGRRGRRGTREQFWGRRSRETAGLRRDPMVLIQFEDEWAVFLWGRDRGKQGSSTTHNATVLAMTWWGRTGQ